jgi:hypothetical protein
MGETSNQEQNVFEQGWRKSRVQMLHGPTHQRSQTLPNTAHRSH